MSYRFRRSYSSVEECMLCDSKSRKDTFFSASFLSDSCTLVSMFKFNFLTSAHCLRRAVIVSSLSSNSLSSKPFAFSRSPLIRLSTSRSLSSSVILLLAETSSSFARRYSSFRPCREASYVSRSTAMSAFSS